jgi:hypothetical protein
MPQFATLRDQFIAIVKAQQCDNPACACRWDPESSDRGDVHCPSHSDTTPSFTVTLNQDRILIYCHAGCEFEDTSQVLRNTGLWTDPPKAGLTLEEFGVAKLLDIAFLKAHGVFQTKYRDLPAVGFAYYDRDKQECGVHLRVSMESDRFRWQNGAASAPYGAHRLQAIYAAKTVIFTEGESSTLTGWHHAMPVVGIPSASGWRSDWAALFPESVKKYIVADTDPAGFGLVDAIVKDLPDALVTFPPEGCADLSAIHLAERGDPEKVKAIVARMLEAAKPASELAEERARAQRHKEAAAAREASADLLDDPKLIDRIDRALGDDGLAGDRKNALLLYLALTSGVMDRPVNVLVEGPSAAGKNFLVDRVSRFIPAEAVYQLTSSSERTFVFTDANLSHRHIIVSEAAGLHHEGIGASIIRSVAWDGQVIYEVVEKGADGKMRTRRIVRPGPTGLVTTTVRALDAELLTRLLSITISDSRDQTAAVVKEAGRRAKLRPARIDTTAFIAAQQWLRLQGIREVVIPFAEDLAELTDTSAVRVRRDFPQLLSLLEASAFLHQRQRERDARGRVIASQEDYELVYRLVHETFRAAAGALTEAQRTAVNAVVEAYTETKAPVTVGQVAKRLGLDPSSARRRLERPIEAGHVGNLAVKGKPYQLKPGDPLIEIGGAIPEPTVLFAAGGEGVPSDAVARPHAAPETLDKQGPEARARGTVRAQSLPQPSIGPAEVESAAGNGDSSSTAQIVPVDQAGNGDEASAEADDPARAIPRAHASTPYLTRPGDPVCARAAVPGDPPLPPDQSDRDDQDDQDDEYSAIV